MAVSKIIHYRDIYILIYSNHGIVEQRYQTEFALNYFKQQKVLKKHKAKNCQKEYHQNYANKCNNR